MSEVAGHGGHEHGHAPAPADAFGRGVSVAVALLGILVAIAGILSHRAHTAAVIERTKVNDAWSYYQAKKLRGHLLEVGTGLARALAPDPARVQDLAARFEADAARYAHESQDLQKEAKALEKESDDEEHRAVRLDIAEGFLELGLVLCSLYFLSKRRFFPVLGAVAAVIGTGLGASGLLM